MRNFYTLLTVNVSSLQTTVIYFFSEIYNYTHFQICMIELSFDQYICLKGEEEAGVIEQLKSQVCDNVGLYAQKYDTEFQVYLPEFVTAIWNLLTTTGQQPKYDSVSTKYDSLQENWGNKY